MTLIGYELAILNFLGLIKLALDQRRNTLLMDNNAALQQITTAVTDATAAMKDLASKAAAGEDISGPLSTLAANLEAAVAGVGEPTTGGTTSTT